MQNDDGVNYSASPDGNDSETLPPTETDDATVSLKTSTNGGDGWLYRFLPGDAEEIHDGWDDAALSLMNRGDSSVVEPLDVSQQILDDWTLPLNKKSPLHGSRKAA